MASPPEGAEAARAAAGRSMVAELLTGGRARPRRRAGWAHKGALEEQQRDHGGGGGRVVPTSRDRPSPWLVGR